MKALIYHGPGKLALEDKPMPIIKTPTDAIVKITKTAGGITFFGGETDE